MSDVFKINTEDEVKGSLQPQIPLFNLVAEDHPVLRERCNEYVFRPDRLDDAQQLASSLVETCKKNQGIGLSANQCGIKLRVFVMGAGEDYVAHFNPKLIEVEGESHMIEGCLSFPLLGLRITRPETITVEYQDYKGESHTAKYTGISARCFLHELDHMDGIVYTDRVKPLALKSGMDKRNKVLKKMAQYQSLLMKQAKQQHGKNTYRNR
jgi:peptide deformylase